MNDQQVLQAILDFYSDYGAGVNANREIARFMRQNNIPVEQVARITGYSTQDVQADYDAFAQQQAVQDAAQQQQAEQLRAQQDQQQAQLIAQQQAQQEAQQAAQQAALQASQQAAAQQAAQQAAAEQASQLAAQQQAAQLAGDAQRAAQIASDQQAAQQAAAQQAAAQQQAPQQQTAAQPATQQQTRQQGQTIMAMTDQQVQDALNTAYSQYGGAGFEAHRAIARFMEVNNVPVDQVARLTGYTPQEVQAEFAAQTAEGTYTNPVMRDFVGTTADGTVIRGGFGSTAQTGGSAESIVREFFQNNPSATDQQIFQFMQQNNLSPDQVIQTMGLEPGDSMRRFNDQLVNTAQRGQVTLEQLRAYFQNNPNATDAEVYANMRAYGVTPQQVGQALGMPLSEVTRRFREQQVEQTPTGLVGFEEAAAQGLQDATTSLRGAETTSRGDINAAMQNINQLLGQNIEGFQQAGTLAGQQVGAGFDQGIETLNRLYGINIDDLRAAADQAARQVNTGFDEARGYFQPFQQGGAQAFQQQLALSGALGQDAFNAARQESPYEQFLFEQGMRGNLAGAAATGGLGGGNVQRELQRFGQGLASQGLQQQISNLSGLSGMGMQGSQALSGLATGRAGALGDIGMNTAQNIAAQRGTQAQGVSGLQTQRGGALGDITLNTMANIAGQRGNMANFQGQAGINLANLSQRAGEGIADMQYGTGRDIATQRARAGELMANQIQDVYGNQSNLLGNLGTVQSNLIGGQSSDLINMQNAAALRAQQNAINLGGNIADLQTGLATSTSNAIQGTPQRINQPFDYAGMYGDAFNAAAGGYDIMNQALNQRQNPAPVSTSIPSYVNPNTYGPMRSGYNMPAQPQFNQRMPDGVYNSRDYIDLGKFA